MVSSTLCPAVHILGSQNVYGRAEGIADHYWPWAVFFFLSFLLACLLACWLACLITFLLSFFLSSFLSLSFSFFLSMSLSVFPFWAAGPKKTISYRTEGGISIRPSEHPNVLTSDCPIVRLSNRSNKRSNKHPSV